MTLKASGGPLYPALSEEPATLPGTRNGGGQYLNALMPRPTDPDVATAETWLRGLAWHPDVTNILLDEPDGDLIDDILELETEIDRHMADILERPGLRPAQDPESSIQERDWLIALPAAKSIAGKPGKMPAFEKIVFALMHRHQPAEYSLIHDMSPGLSLGENVPAMLNAARGLAKAWLEQEGFIEPDHPYNPMGTICGHHRLTPDTPIERAAFVHMFLGQPLAGALFESLLEFRVAQLERHLDNSSPWLLVERLKTILMDEPMAPLDHYAKARSDPAPEM